MKEKHTRIGNMAITAAILAATSGFSYLLHRVSNSDFHVPMLFVLAGAVHLSADGWLCVWHHCFHGRGDRGELYLYLSLFCIEFYDYRISHDISDYAGSIYLCQRTDYQDQKAGADPAGSGEGEDPGQPAAGHIS